MATENNENIQDVNDKEMDINPVEAQEQNTEAVEENSFEAELEKEKDKFLRLFAEFENFRRRTAKERLELMSTASEGVITSLLPVLDDFDRALEQIEARDLETDLKGFSLISSKLRDTLSSKGLMLVDIAKGDIFNADLAEAVTQVPAGDEMKGKIVDIIEKGYKLGDKIIRFPKVVIGQ